MTDPQIQSPGRSPFHTVPTAPVAPNTRNVGNSIVKWRDSSREFGVDMHTPKPGFPMQLPNLGALFRREIDSIFLMSFACERHLVNICG